MRVTINDIAKAAQVSASTVSRVIADSPKISMETKERILKIMSDLHYHPHFIARSLSSKKSQIIGVVIPTKADIALQHPFFSEVLRGICSVAYKKSYNILISFSDDLDSEKKNIDHFIKGGISDGIIFLSSNINESIRSELIDMQFPFVVIGRPKNENKLNWVDNDNYQIGFELTEYFIKKGHRNIVFLGFSPSYNVTLDRLNGYKNALESNGIDINPDFLIDGEFDNSNTISNHLKKLFLGKIRPTAIITSDDFLAFEVIKYLLDSDIKVPQDIAVSGINNVPVSEFFSPTLTSVDVNAYLLGLKAFELLDKVIENSFQKNYKYFERIIVPSDIIERDSTK